MKQHTDLKQWEGLNGKQMINLVKSNLTTPHRNGKEIKEWHSMNIGQMIEFLGHAWYEGIYGDTREASTHPLFKGELCDALWEAVKHKLNQ